MRTDAEEVLEIKSALRQFCGHMERKLIAKAREDGWSGWDNPHFQPEAENRLIEHALRMIRGDKAQAVDVANFAMFVWWITEQQRRNQ